MFCKPIYIAFSFFICLLFTSQKSNGAGNFISSGYKTIENVSKSPIDNPYAKANDLLMDIDDDDDETSSKTKHRLSKTSFTLVNKFKTSKQILASANSTVFNFNHYPANRYFNVPHCAKTSISLAICCLRI